LPQHVSANHCHHQEVVVSSEATQAISVLCMYMDYDSSSVVSCRGMQPRVYCGFSSCGPTTTSTHLLVILQRYYTMLGPTIKMIFLSYLVEPNSDNKLISYIRYFLIHFQPRLRNNYHLRFPFSSHVKNICLTPSTPKNK
jgi:hypothetical protein